MRMDGCKAVIGSWKIIAISLPRKDCQSDGDSFEILLPRTSAWVLVIEALGLSKPMLIKALTDFPEPLSPTTETISPSSIFKLKSLSTSVVPKEMFKPCMLTSGEGIEAF